MAKKNNKKQESMIIVLLGKIFSLQFFGVILAAVGLYFTYATFIQDKPGVLRLMTKSGKLNEKIKTVYYGFEIKSDSTLIMDLPEVPILANATSNTIQDITVFAYTPKNYKVYPNSRYVTEPEEMRSKKEISIGKVSYALRQDKINPMDGIYWPVSIIYNDMNEILDFPIEIYYSYKTKEMTNILFHIFGIPNKHGSLTPEDIEENFINLIRPHILASDRTDEIAIIYNNKIVQSPSKRKLNQNNLTISNILELN